MIVHNLTDVPSPGRPKRGPQTLRIFGKFIAPGENGEFPDDSPLGKISGWVYSGKVSVDMLPSWYRAARKAKSVGLKVVHDESPKLVEPKGSSTTVDVGVMEVTVGTGPDEKLGTEDDEVEVKPKKGKKKGKKK